MGTIDDLRVLNQLGLDMKGAFGIVVSKQELYDVALREGVGVERVVQKYVQIYERIRHDKRIENYDKEIVRRIKELAKIGYFKGEW